MNEARSSASGGGWGWGALASMRNVFVAGIAFVILVAALVIYSVFIRDRCLHFRDAWGGEKVWGGEEFAEKLGECIRSKPWYSL